MASFNLRINFFEHIHCNTFKFFIIINNRYPTKLNNFPAARFVPCLAQNDKLFPQPFLSASHYWDWQLSTLFINLFLFLASSSSLPMKMRERSSLLLISIWLASFSFNLLILLWSTSSLSFEAYEVFSNLSIIFFKVVQFTFSAILIYYFFI